MGISNRLHWAAICTSAFLTSTTADALTMIAENVCDESILVGNYISQQYGEKPLALGTGRVYIMYGDGTVEPNIGMFSIWINQDSGTFTNTISFTDGITCITMTGQNFEPYVD